MLGRLGDLFGKERVLVAVLAVFACGGLLGALAPSLPGIDLFQSSALAAALGRDHAVHAVVARGRLAAGLARDAARLRGLKGPQGHPDPEGPPGDRDAHQESDKGWGVGDTAGRPAM